MSDATVVDPAVSDPSVVIRPFVASDGAEVAALAADAWPRDDFMRSGHEQHGEPCDADPFRRCLVAIDEPTGGQVVGVFSLVRPPAHPLRLELVGTVAATHRRLGIASALVDSLRRDCPDEILRSRIRPNDLSARLFLATRGFTSLMRNRVLAVDPAHPQITAWCGTVSVPAGYELVTDGLAPDDVLDLCHAIYVQGHGWNPPAEFTLQRKRDAYFGGIDLLPEPLIATRIGGELAGIAYGECAEGNSDELFIMPSGVLGLDRPGATEATAAMIAYCLTWARDRNRTVIFEVDDAEEHVATVLGTLPTRLYAELLHFELTPAVPRTVE